MNEIHGSPEGISGISFDMFSNWLNSKVTTIQTLISMKLKANKLPMKLTN